MYAYSSKHYQLKAVVVVSGFAIQSKGEYSGISINPVRRNEYRIDLFEPWGSIFQNGFLT